jgi:GT2 family glycosyltransferase
VIVNWGTPDYTIRSVEALIADGVPARRMVVVDNGSEDSSYEQFRERLAECVLVKLERNVGYVRAANVGAQALDGDHYLFVNNDAFVHRPGSVRTLLAALADESVGIAVPRILNEDLTLQPTVSPLQTPGVALVRASGLSRMIPNRWQPGWSTHWDHGCSREIQSAAGVVMLVRGETWRQLGAFDERIFLYAEDHDLCWRARSARWKIWFVLEAEFVHIGQGTIGAQWASPKRAEVIGEAMAAMTRRNLSPLSARLAIAFTSAGLGARWLVFTVTGRREAAASVLGALRGYRANST